MASNIFQVHAGRGISFVTLGASLHDILTRLRNDPQAWPKVDISYSTAQPVASPVILSLPCNGMRLRFDGRDQRLRLIEVVDFSKCGLSYKDRLIVRLPEANAVAAGPLPTSIGPSFRHVYNKLFGPAFPGEYMPPQSGAITGTYVLSYPGIAFNFPLQASAWSPSIDFVSLLSSSATSAATSMAIFSGNSWAEARSELYTRQPSNPRSLALVGRGKDTEPDEVELVKVHGDGRIELIRRSSAPFWIILNETTPQDLITELGPPDGIYQKHDHRLSIHKARTVSGTSNRPRAFSSTTHNESYDTDRSSSYTETSDSDNENASTSSKHLEYASAECFYNYSNHGMDILISQPSFFASHSAVNGRSRASTAQPAGPTYSETYPPLTVAKVVLHGNVPGSYSFNRHRRIRWALEDFSLAQYIEPLNSERSFAEIYEQLQEAFKGTYTSEEEEQAQQLPMVLNRGSGESPSDSCELLGGWEEAVEGDLNDDIGTGDEQGFFNTEMFGFPGLVFEVLKNKAVSCLTVY